MKRQRINFGGFAVKNNNPAQEEATAMGFVMSWISRLLGKKKNRVVGHMTHFKSLDVYYDWLYGRISIEELRKSDVKDEVSNIEVDSDGNWILVKVET